MRIFSQMSIDFLRLRWAGAAFSAVLIMTGIGSLVYKGGPALGIDFAGGSQVVVRFVTPPSIDTLRQALLNEGLAEVQIQEFEQGSNEFLIRTPGGQEEGSGVVSRINTVVDRVDTSTALGVDQLDLNNAGQDQLTDLLVRENPGDFEIEVELERATQTYRDAIDGVLVIRANVGLIEDWSQLNAVNSDIVDVLREHTVLGGHAVGDAVYVGPQVGEDLRRQTTQAIVFALCGLLAYITYRFEFKFGIAAVIALIHDVTIALGAFSLTNREFNLPVVAAFLTIIGYSLNDTVVIFDRIRENNQVMRRLNFYDRINKSLNQTLSRTLLTSGTTMVVVFSLFVYGGRAINDFSFALLIGVVVGTYSSMFVASPVVYEWQRMRNK